MMNIMRWCCAFIAGVYLLLYPTILLVPSEYRAGYWSGDYNVARRGLVIGRDIYEIKSLLHHHKVYRVAVMIKGQPEYFWVANAAVGSELITGEMASFETRGKVIVLANIVDRFPPIFSLLN